LHNVVVIPTGFLIEIEQSQVVNIVDYSRYNRQIHLQILIDEKVNNDVMIIMNLDKPPNLLSTEKLKMVIIILLVRVRLFS
jgi:hypothetical protein